jgi:murein DD-endopeptidase MepM/ murein hydrolase activator NlpD
MPSEPLPNLSVDLPLRGEWVAVNTPARRVPSHGTDMLGQRYAFDFLRIDDRKGLRFFPGSRVRYWSIGIPVKTCYGWGAEVRSPFNGQVVKARDGIAERGRLHPVVNLLRAFKNGLTFDPTRTELDLLVGNHVILERSGVFAGFAHLAPGSVAVNAGQEVRTGDLLGEVGHTGNSTAPHLHFQLMDRAEILTARGLPCAFREYEALRDGRWMRVTDEVPGHR